MFLSYIIGNSTNPGPEWKRRPIGALGVVWKFWDQKTTYEGGGGTRLNLSQNFIWTPSSTSKWDMLISFFPHLERKSTCGEGGPNGLKFKFWEQFRRVPPPPPPPLQSLLVFFFFFFFSFFFLSTFTPLFIKTWPDFLLFFQYWYAWGDGGGERGEHVCGVEIVWGK